MWDKVGHRKVYLHKDLIHEIGLTSTFVHFVNVFWGESRGAILLPSSTSEWSQDLTSIDGWAAITTTAMRVHIQPFFGESDLTRTPVWPKKCQCHSHVAKMEPKPGWHWITLLANTIRWSWINFIVAKNKTSWQGKNFSHKQMEIM